MSPVWESYRCSDGTLDVSSAFVDAVWRTNVDTERLRIALNFLGECDPVTRPASADILFQHAMELMH